MPDAAAARDFYAAVVGWTVEPLDMGGYDDYVMRSPDGAGIAGICHARGVNADLPPQWMLYVTVADVDASAAKCVALGGRLVRPPADSGDGTKMCVIQDPAGAYMTLSGPAAAAQNPSGAES